MKRLIVGALATLSTSTRFSTKYGPFRQAIPGTYMPMRAESVFWPIFAPAYLFEDVFLNAKLGAVENLNFEAPFRPRVNRLCPVQKSW